MRSVFKNCQGSKILPFLQTNMLAYHRFMDAGGRHEIARTDQKHFTNQISRHKLHFSFASLWLCLIGPDGCIHNGFASPLRDTEFRKPQCYTRMWFDLSLSGTDNVFAILDYKQIYSLFQRETLSLYSKAIRNLATFLTS